MSESGTVICCFCAGALLCAPLAPAARPSLIVPLHFEANRGQADPEVRFLAWAGRYGVFLTDGAAVVVFTGENGTPDVSMRMVAVGAQQHISPSGTGLLDGRTNYFMSADRRNWRTGIPNYTGVKYPGLYPGIDLIFHGMDQQLEYDFVVAPGADAGEISLRFEGSGEARIDSDGDLALGVGGRPVRQRKPDAYQWVGGVRRRIEGAFVIRSDRTVGFQVSHYDHRQPLIIDPLVYSFGEAGAQGAAVAVDAAGNAYVAGSATPPALQTTTGAFKPTFDSGTCDYGTSQGMEQLNPCPAAFVYKLSPDGSKLIYATYLGTGNAMAMAIDGTGNAYVTGQYNPMNGTGASFPVTPGSLPKGGQSGAFVAKLNAQGDALEYSAILGAFSSGNGIAVDSAGNAYVAGTTSATFPTTAGAFQTTFEKSAGGFLLKLNTTGTALAYSTLLGGAGTTPDSISAIAIDSEGEAFVTGAAGTTVFPTTPGAFQTAAKGPNAFVTKLSADGSSLVYSTLLGGTGPDVGSGISVDPLGEAYVAGSAISADFPAMVTLSPAPGSTSGGAFISKLSAAGDSLLFSTIISGTSAFTLAIDQEGASYMAGIGGAALVTSNAELRCSFLYNNALALKLSPDGSTLLYSSFIGNTEAYVYTGGLAVDISGNMYIPNDHGLWKISPETGTPIVPPCFDGMVRQQNEVISGQIAPGEEGVLYGTNLGPQKGVNGTLTSSGVFATTLAGTSVLVGGIAAPMLYAAANKVSFMAPFEVAGAQVSIEVVHNGEKSDPHTTPAFPSAPAAIVDSATLGCQGAVLNQDGSVNASANPAAIGSVISVFATGTGAFDRPLADGSLVTFPLPMPVSQPVLVYFGYIANYGTTLWAGSAPGLIAGTLQINVQIPDTVSQYLNQGLVTFGIDIGGTMDIPWACMYIQ